MIGALLKVPNVASDRDKTYLINSQFFESLMEFLRSKQSEQSHFSDYTVFNII